MPIKSKDQWKKLFALSGRGEISEDKVKEMTRETKTPYSKLPTRKKKACLKAAVLMGQMRALDENRMLKEAGVIESLLVKYAPLWAPAGLGAALGGPEHRLEGAAAGLGGGILGTRLMRSIALKQTPELAQFAKLLQRPETLHKVIAKKPELSEQLGALEKSEWLGRLTGGAGGGLAAHKILSPQKPELPAMEY